METPKKKSIRDAISYSALPSLGKLPPHDIELERSFLGMIMLYPLSIFKVINNFKPEHFYKEEHKEIATTILHMVEHQIPIDILSVVLTGKKLSYNIDAYTVSTMTTAISGDTSLDYYHKLLLEMYIKRDIINVCNVLEHKAFLPETEIDELIEGLSNKLEDMGKIFENEQKTHVTDSVNEAISDIMLRQEPGGTFYYPIGCPDFDNLVRFERNNVMLLGGKSGSGKTRFVTFLMRRLLAQHSDIAILWYSMEDPPAKIIRCFLSQSMGLSDSQLLGVNYKILPDQLQLMLGLKEEINKWDLEFVGVPARMKYVRLHFEQFCKRRQDKMCILIIDNLMLLDDNNDREVQTKIDDRIASEIKKAQINTQQTILMVHHFTDEQLDKVNLSSGYRPSEKHLKGSTRYRDISTQIVLCNNPEQYPDLLDVYKEREYLRHMFITDVVKVRNGAIGTARWMKNLATNRFYEV